MMQPNTGLATILLVTMLYAPHSRGAGAEQEVVAVSDFKAGALHGWKEKVFQNNTQYTFVESDTGTVLRADAQASASGLFRKIRIDLNKTPCLTWSWRVDQPLTALDETTKAGDDYAARVYVVFSGGLAFWDTRAINYVWSGQQDVGTSWPNAYTSRSLNVAVQSGAVNSGKWVQQTRNVRTDYRNWVGKDIHIADAVAIMSDTDNSGRATTAYYGDIQFTNAC